MTREKYKKTRPLGLGDVEKGKRDPEEGKGTVRETHTQGSHLVHVGSQRAMPSGSR